jgi:hypothetical protein
MARAPTQAETDYVAAHTRGIVKALRPYLRPLKEGALTVGPSDANAVDAPQPLASKGEVHAHAQHA